MNRALLVFVVCACVVIAGCPKKETSFEENVAKSFEQAGIQPPLAGGATVRMPENGIVVFIHHDQLALDTLKGMAAFATLGSVKYSPSVVIQLDPARAATDGADVKYKRDAKDPMIVPLRNALSVELDRGAPKRMIIASNVAPPPRLLEEVKATFADSGVTEAYRLVRAKDGKIAAERLP
jgi:hypothetical protein